MKSISDKKLLAYTISVAALSFAVVSAIDINLLTGFGETEDDAAYTIEIDSALMGSSRLVSSESIRGQEPIPARYDLREHYQLMDIKNQLNTNTCWAHTLLDSLESSLILKGQADSTIDFSETNLVYFTTAYGISENESDPLYLDGCTQKDTYQKGKDAFVGTNAFGSPSLGIDALASGKGMGLESAFPSILEVQNQAGDITIDESYRYDSAYQLLNAYRFSYDDKDSIKESVMKYGSAIISYYENNENYNNGAYYQNHKETQNHEAVIIGWDDNYSRENFKSNNNSMPEQNGAWICRNSYGTKKSYMNEGYFYLSYEDASIGSVVYNLEATQKNYANIYQYDGVKIAYKSTVSGNQVSISTANVFTAETNENLTEVSYYTENSDVNCTIQIYALESDAPTPTSDTLLYEGTILEPHAGYHTFSLDQSVTIPEGTPFSVVLTQQNTQEDAPVYIIADDHREQENVSYYRYNENKWEECVLSLSTGSISCSPCIKVFTTEGVPVNDASFPDSNFRNYVEQHFDSDHNYVLTEDEIAQAKEIDLTQPPVYIENLEGIKILTALTSLKAENCKLESVDFSENTALSSVSLSNISSENPLILDFTQNKALESLSIRDSHSLAEIKGSMKQLKDLYLHNNQNLSVLNLSQCESLEKLTLISNGLASCNLPEELALSDETCDIRDNKAKLTQESCGALVLTHTNGMQIDRMHNINGAFCSDDQLFPYDSNITFRYVCNENIQADFGIVLNTAHRFPSPSEVPDKNMLTCLNCGTSFEIDHTHQYDNNCYENCNICNAVRTVSHSPIWKYNTSEHYQVCKVCGEGLSESDAHIYDNDCDTDCNLCGSVRVTSHLYQSECDTDCDICGAVRTVSHQPNVVYTENEHHTECSLCHTALSDAQSHDFAETVITSEGHAYRCSCGAVTELQSHDYISYETEESHGKICSVCQNTIEMESHVFKTVCMDETTHSDLCDCGAVSKTESHRFTIKSIDDETHSVTCADCGYTYTENHDYVRNNGNTNYHWDLCQTVGCGHIINKEKHRYILQQTETEHYTGCENCGRELNNRKAHTFAYAPVEGGHQLMCSDSACQYAKGDILPHETEILSSDETGHHLRCTVCGEEWDETHSYVTKADEDAHWEACEICMFCTQKTEHNIITQWDETIHKTICIDCETVLIEGETHDLQPEHNESGHYLICSNPDCDYTEQFLPHDFTMESENGMHYGLCKEETCGYRTESEAHKLISTRMGDLVYTYCEHCSYTEENLLGDMNQDGEITMADIVALQKNLMTSTEASEESDPSKEPVENELILTGFDLAKLKRSLIDQSPT